jgi:hypothetical protein
MLSNAYIAGFFDGEGTTDIHINKRLGTCTLRVCFFQKRRAVLEMIQQQYGGQIGLRTRPKYRWYTLYLSGKEAEAILKAIKRYLVVKKREVECGLEFEQKKHRYRRAKKKYNWDDLLLYNQKMKDIRREENQKDR